MITHERRVDMMQGKIGILTFHRALSYGAMLQAYALQTKLSALEIENEIIDYTCKYMVKHYQRLFRPVKANALRGFAYNLLTAGGIRKERKTRDRFVRKHLKLSKTYQASDIAQAAQEYALLITGSDQVWSPTCAGFDPAYFLGFAAPEQRYSYAASIAVKTLPAELRDEYRKRLKDFAAFSVREQSGAELIRQLTGRDDAQVHIDPTLLLKREAWDNLAPASPVRTPYILLFTVNAPRTLIDQTLVLSRRTGLPIIYLNKLHVRREKEIRYLEPIEADQFVSLVKHAAYVCTNSFHGTAFSVIYHKQFIVETETVSGRNIRAEELLSRLGLSERILQGDISAIDAQSDWASAESILAEERRRAEAYLLDIGQRARNGRLT